MTENKMKCPKGHEGEKGEWIMTLEEFKKLDQSGRNAYAETLPIGIVKNLNYDWKSVRNKDDITDWGEWIYDEKGRLIAMISGDGEWEEKVYDKNDNLLKYEDSNGKMEKWNYDKRNNIIFYTDCKGFSWEKTFDEQNRQLTYKSNQGISCEWVYGKTRQQIAYKDNFGYYIIKHNQTTPATKERYEKHIKEIKGVNSA